MVSEDILKEVKRIQSESGDLVLVRYKNEVAQLIGALACSDDWYCIVFDTYLNPHLILLGEFITLKDKIDIKDYENLIRYWPDNTFFDFKRLLEARFPKDLIILKEDKEEDWTKQLTKLELIWEKENEELYKKRDKLNQYKNGIKD